MMYCKCKLKIISDLNKHSGDKLTKNSIGSVKGLTIYPDRKIVTKSLWEEHLKNGLNIVKITNKTTKYH